ncbi:hypothetical protein [Xanthomonas pisi]|uniref:hypothetical protein n=1 Tax=Xanthomonas pisi TaxID=56457 RepID=UPI0011B0E100|nr:hypothetical protein [Xanthomonas pisi]
MKIIFSSILLIGMSFSAVSTAEAATYQTITEGYARDIGGTVDATPQCPAGFTPISGGWNTGDPNVVRFWGRRAENSNLQENMNLGRFSVVGSYPSGNGWRTYGYTNGPVVINVYTICASG